ncbi:lys-63-specific deubiquitinase BRCC36-like [Bacillus rossius redtenbacheri]|uniref:lys-63-specific deubiquitinase BRCC36-like n=1 Tax=Bacillus rossius redtenbacheri TaxID=93214 RepID=UPI002FDCF23B
MALNSVCMTSDVYLVCLQHALSTEKEEVMGLLIGEIDSKKTLHISAVVVLRRSDKRKDRVEISPEQLSNAAVHAERLSHELNQPMRVLGWYHSHPHITVCPSHIDVTTQAMYQMMDKYFVGIIFSVFSETKTTKEQQVQVTCFQSLNKNPDCEPPAYVQVEVPLHFVPASRLSRPCLQSMIELPEILFQEEKDCYDATRRLQYLSVVDQLNNDAVFTKAMCHITEMLTAPLVKSLEQRRTLCRRRLDELLREREQIMTEKLQA